MIPVSPFSAARKRINSECEDDNDDDNDDDEEFKSLLSVYDGKSATSVEEVKRFSATKIWMIEIESTEINNEMFSQANMISIISICIEEAEKAQW